MPWTIDGIEADFVADGTPPTLTRGTEVTLPLVFENTGNGAVEPSDSRYSVQYSFNYEGPQTKSRFRTNYNDLLDYLTYRGEDIVRFGTTDRGVPWFRERLPDGAPVDSLVVPVDAPDDIPEDRSMWAILVGGEDRSTAPSSFRRVDVQLFVLAERAAYETRADVEAAFADELTV